jgi:hypothetical protein
MIDGSFRSCQRQGHALDIREPVEALAESCFQPGHHQGREQVRHPQFDERLVVRLRRVVELGRTPVLRLPTVKDLWDAGARLFA